MMQCEMSLLPNTLYHIIGLKAFVSVNKTVDRTIDPILCKLYDISHLRKGLPVALVSWVFIIIMAVYGIPHQRFTKLGLCCNEECTIPRNFLQNKVVCYPRPFLSSYRCISVTKAPQPTEMVPLGRCRNYRSQRRHWSSETYFIITAPAHLLNVIEYRQVNMICDLIIFRQHISITWASMDCSIDTRNSKQSNALYRNHSAHVILFDVLAYMHSLRCFWIILDSAILANDHIIIN